MAYTQFTTGPSVIGSREIVPQLQAINEVVSTTPRYTLGTRVKALDPDTGYEATFQYCGGVASVVAGDAVCVSGDNLLTRTLAATTGLCGVAMSAIDAATKFGWVAIDGVVPVNVAAGCAANPAYTTATAGVLDDAVVAGSEVPGASFISAIGTPAAGQSYIRLNKSGVV
jgi:hypothetical protein